MWQAAIRLPHEQLSQLQEKTDSLLGLPQHPATTLHRRYHYSDGSEVQRIVDKQRGITDFHYDASGQLRSRQPNHPQLHTEDFSYDPAGNLCGSGNWQFDRIQNNRLVAFKDLRFTYDDWGNLSEKSSTNGATQRFTYDCENRLIHAQTWHGATLHSEARYHYDALGRRIAKCRHAKRPDPRHDLPLARPAPAARTTTTPWATSPVATATTISGAKCGKPRSACPMSN
ncbi:RHS repeat domain-containing protein [Pseudomonas sp. 910_21]|uniref:RHS repeat domain-containing protein n=1 Tax=Pseudomonas sp. 910_21 TaxID=2604460 RepID=UPI004064B52B